jgi:GNAT superfamily N-acetyltransferase
MTIELQPLSAGDTEGLQARYEILAAAEAFDLPYGPPTSRRDKMAELAHQFAGSRNLYWLVRSGDGVVGAASLQLPILDNQENAAIDLVIHPDHRRQGIGTMVLEHLVAAARAEARCRIIGELCQDGPLLPSRERGAAAFAGSCGAKEALVEVRRRLEVTALDRAHLGDLLADAEARSADYHLVPWANVTPDEVVEGVATLESRMVEDAPMGELAWEPEAYDANRWTADQATLLARGRRTYGCASVHTTTGDVTGFTLCVIDEDVPQHAWQWTTIVLPWHRGHRLGMRLKASNTVAMLASEPQLETVDTWNAEVNGPMIAVNELLGFRVLDTWSEWQLEIG